MREKMDTSWRRVFDVSRLPALLFTGCRLLFRYLHCGCWCGQNLYVHISAPCLRASLMLINQVSSTEEDAVLFSPVVVFRLCNRRPV